MLNQTLRNICSFFSPGKKSIFVSGNQENTRMQADTNSNDTSSIRLLYHRENNDIHALETKPDLMQHDWWIN